MGIDVPALHLLALARARGADFSRTLTIGRQSLQLDDAELAGFLERLGRPDLARDPAAVRRDGYCETLLREAFGAKENQSIDAAPYEHASIIHDMNLPFAPGEQYSAVLDIGCLEHVFNFPVAVANVVAACAIGGHIVHVLPGNNLCGHGFYQFSPELFFSLYSAERGFGDTDVYLVELARPARWYRVSSPSVLKRRVNVVNRERTYVFVLTRKAAHAASPLEHPPQQSDYVEQWRSAAEVAATGGERRRRRALSALARTLREGLRRVRCRLLGTRERLHPGRTDVQPVRVEDWLP